MIERLSDLTQRMCGSLVGEDANFAGFALDSREVTPRTVFVAIRGAKVDGHSFTATAMNSGAAACLVEAPIEGRHILVPDVIAALAKFGRSIREEFHGPVVGITGSNGKTTAKEMVSAALTPLGPVLKNVGNQNSEYTSPLTWYQLRPEHRAAVIEMGMRGFHQIEHLAQVSLPNLGLITMIGTAHIEMVGTRQGIAEAKTELFRAMTSDGIAHGWAEDDFVAYQKSQAPGRFRTFGFGPDAELKVVGYRALSLDRCEILVSLGDQKARFELPTIGRHQALNAAAALLVADSAGVKLSDAVEAIQEVDLPPMRMEMVNFGPAKVLLDTYNASPDSMVAALRTLAELPCEGRRFAVIGEMKELGSMSELGHRQVGRELAKTPLDTVLLFGNDTHWVRAEAMQAGFSPEKLIEATTLHEVRSFLEDLKSGDLVLLKGSRALGLEQALQQGAGA